MKISHTIVAAATLAALAGAASSAEAQRTTRPTRRQAAIEIRGQVPTPQVTTVRPREVPAYDRRVLVPDFYDHNFWQSILPAYQLVPARVVTGAPLSPTTAPGSMPGAMPSSTPPGSAPAAGAPPVTPPAGAPPARPASTTPGTAPATPQR
jgi:hypothetical protein